MLSSLKRHEEKKEIRKNDPQKIQTKIVGIRPNTSVVTVNPYLHVYDGFPRKEMTINYKTIKIKKNVQEGCQQ